MSKILIYSKKPDLHSLYDILISNPPEGYEVISTKIKKSKLYKLFSKISFLKRIYRIFIRIGNPILKQALETKNDKISKDFNLILSPGRIFLKENPPHIVDIVDKITALSGNDLNLLYKNKKLIENALCSKSCKRIICWTNACKRDFEEFFNNPVINSKLVVVNFAKPSPIINKIKHKTFNLLFVGSINNPEDFLIKGGLESIYAFSNLTKKYSNLNLYIKCKVPEKIKKKVSHLKNLHIIEKIISDEELNNLYKQSDIFLAPSHNISGLAPIEAMSFGLPVIVLDTWASDEIVTNNYNGLIVNKSKLIPYDKKIYLDIRNKKFLKMIENPDPVVISELSDKIITLMENPKLCSQLGKNAKKLTVNGKFSLPVRNKKLKTIFDEALK